MLPRGQRGPAMVELLRGQGLHLDTGAVVSHLRIADRGLAEVFLEAYADFPLEATPQIDDFRVAVTRAPRWFGTTLGSRNLQTEIDGEVPFPPFPSRYAFPVLESALNWCLAERIRRCLVFHAAAVERDGLAVLIAGDSGAGKSTLCAALSQSGWRLLSDELVLLRLGSAEVVANPRPISLKNAAIDVIERRAPQARFSPRYEETLRGTIAFLYPTGAAVAARATGARPMLAIAPTYRAGARPSERKMRRAEGFTWLVQNAVNYFASLRAGFETLADLVEHMPCYEVTYDDLDAMLDRIGALHEAAARRRAA